MTFTEELRPVVDPIWDAIISHPMVEGIGTGTLDEEPFRYWVKQDYRYLIEYSRVFALGAAKSPTIDDMGTFSTLLTETIHTEMDLHRSYAATFGISEADLEETTPSPTTQAYTDFLVRTATMGTFGDIIAVLLPCMWGFNETGKQLASNGLPSDERYAEWIEMYASDEFSELTDWCHSLMNRVAANAHQTDRERYIDLVRTSAQYEYLFWEAAWNQESWPV